MKNSLPHTILKYLIATIWLINGLFCKVLNWVPRHQEIVSKILGSEYAALFTKAIGVSEIFMAFWIISSIKSRFNAILQIGIIALMNILEFVLVPELLIWGRLNILFASLLIFVIYYHEFILKKKLHNGF